MKCRILIPAFLIVTASVSVAKADITVSTTHNDDIYYLGVSDTQTYGQTFLALGSTLKSYSFNLNNFGTTDQDFGFYVGSWSGSGVGSILFSQSLSIAAGSGDLDFTLNPMLALTTGSEYIAFISTSDYSQRADSLISQAGSNDSYSDGQFLYINNGTDTSQWYGNNWSSWTVPQSAFRATFATGSVPAPGAVLPMVCGLIGLARRSRKR